MRRTEELGFYLLDNAMRSYCKQVDQFVLCKKAKRTWDLINATCSVTTTNFPIWAKNTRIRFRTNIVRTIAIKEFSWRWSYLLNNINITTGSVYVFCESIGCVRNSKSYYEPFQIFGRDVREVRHNITVFWKNRKSFSSWFC